MSKNARNENSGVTIADVAKAAGVSVPTVSRILNGKEYVAEETRQRVNEAIRTLGYTPHTQARRLRGGASMTLALHHPIESPHELSTVIETSYFTGTAEAASEKYSAKSQKALDEAARYFDEAYDAAANRYGAV